MPARPDWLQVLFRVGLALTFPCMRKLTVFNSVSLDGYFTDEDGDMSWAHKSDPEFAAWTAKNAGGGGALVMGRVTYEMMEAYWPTPQAKKDMPSVAAAMTRSEKIVFSKTLRKPTWENTRVVKGAAAKIMSGLKAEKGPDMVILGSGTLVAALTEAGLVDAYTLVVNPIVLGAGRTLFEGVERRPELALENARTFKNGNVVLSYAAKR